jgi:heat shock protein HslJ
MGIYVEAISCLRKTYRPESNCAHSLCRALGRIKGKSGCNRATIEWTVVAAKIVV